MFSEISDPLSCVLVLVGLFYVGLPLFCRFQQRYPARPDLRPLNFDNLDSTIARFLTQRSEAVLRLGFSEPTLARIVGAAPGVRAYIVLMIHRERGDRAIVTFMGTGSKAGLNSLQTSYVEYSTRFESGRVFNTLNSRMLLAFPPAPLATRTQTPSVADPEELYRLHRFVMDREAAEGPTIVYPPGEALEWLVENAFRKMYDLQAARGWLRYCSSDDSYRLTFLGAYRVVWGLVPPLKWLRQLLLFRRGKMVLRELRASHHEQER